MTQHTKTMLVLVAGVDTLRRPDANRKIELPHGNAVMLQLRTYRDLDEVPELLRMDRHRDTELVHIANDLKVDHVSLSQACRHIACAVSQHPNKPWVTLDEVSLNWVRTIFVGRGVRIFAGRPQECLRDRWRRFTKERVKVQADSE